MPHSTAEQRRAYNKAYRKKHGRTKEFQRMNQKAMERRLELGRIKMEKGCVDCGFNAHYAALDFDHRDPSEKLFTVSQQLWSRNWDSVLAEIEKCDVRCANCHRIRSHMEKHNHERHLKAVI